MASTNLTSRPAPAVEPEVQPDDFALATPEIETLARVQTFYDKVGWQRDEDGVTQDKRLFGVREDGPIRQALHRLRLVRIRESLAADDASGLSMLECGCGGNPAFFLARLFDSYTGVDFSRQGLDVAQERMADAGLSGSFVQAELSALPFDDNTFDAVYSAHALYHIADVGLQERALEEIMRVVKPGGRVALVLANPRPLLFPARLLRRVLADTPGISSLLNRLRRAAPLPYKPMTLGWTRRRLRRHGSVDITCYAIASTWFSQDLSEHRGIGRAAWKSVAWMERRWPRLSARLGNYVLITVRKAPKSDRQAGHRLAGGHRLR